MEYLQVRRLRVRGKPTRYYYVRTIADDGKRTWTPTRAETLSDAKDVIKTWRARDARGERPHESALFGAPADAWLKEKTASASERTIVVYRSHVKRFKEHFGRRKLRGITREQIAAYLLERKNDGASARTRNNERTYLRGIFQYAIDTGIATLNPVRAIKKIREPKRNPRTLDAREVEKLLETAQDVADQCYGFILTLDRSGLRRGTVARLEWTDVDFARGEWRIPAAKMKSGEDFTGRPIAADLLAYLRDRARTAGPIFGPLAVEDWRRAVKKAGLEDVRPHDLRRTFLTRCRMEGMPMEVAMYLSDHRDLSVVLSVYRAVEPAEARKWLSRVLGGGS